MNDEQDFFEAGDDEWLFDEHADRYERCDCKLCRCYNMTEYGAKCSECRSGAHQG